MMFQTHALTLTLVIAGASGCGQAARGSERTTDASSSETLTTCPTSSAPATGGEVSSSELDEASGLVASMGNPGLLYAHNDSGGRARVYALRSDGALVATINVSGAQATDWEDIALGPGPSADINYIYVGDIGDNAAARTGIRVYRFPEPAINSNVLGQTLSATAEALALQYPDGAHNAETLLVDPTNGDLFVLTKHDSGASVLYVARAPLSKSATRTMEAVAGVQFGSGALPGSRLATGGDVSKDGSAILVRTYTSAYSWRRASGTSLADAFGTSPCAMAVPSERQGEAIAFAHDDGAYYTLSEGSRPPIYGMALTL